MCVAFLMIALEVEYRLLVFLQTTLFGLLKFLGSTRRKRP